MLYASLYSTDIKLHLHNLRYLGKWNEGQLLSLPTPYTLCHHLYPLVAAILNDVVLMRLQTSNKWLCRCFNGGAVIFRKKYPSSVHVLPMPVWVYPWGFGFLPPSKTCMIGLILLSEPLTKALAKIWSCSLDTLLQQPTAPGVFS